jgi:hypothetical protein
MFLLSLDFLGFVLDLSWISLVLFVRIGTFQCVTTIPNKIYDCLRLCAECLKRSSLHPARAARPATRSFNPATRKTYNTFFSFSQTISLISDSADPNDSAQMGDALESKLDQLDPFRHSERALPTMRK